jgi:hypothetical protein
LHIANLVHRVGLFEYSTAPEGVTVNAVDPGGPKDKPAKDKKEGSWTEKIKLIGGLVAVGLGVIAVGTIAIVAIHRNTDTASTIAGAAAGVIATIVGAYFGVKIGTDQTKNAMDQTTKAMDKQTVEATKAQVFAAHLPPQEAKDILDIAEAAGRSILGK